MRNLWDVWGLHHRKQNFRHSSSFLFSPFHPASDPNRRFKTRRVKLK